MTTHYYLYPIAVLIAALMMVEVFRYSPKSKGFKIVLLIAADVILILSLLFFMPHTNLSVVPISVVFVVLTILAIRKIFSPDKPEQQAVYDAWHDDPSNWRGGMFYYNPKDKRIFPPKRIKSFGWTVNFANPYSILVLTAIIILSLLIIYFAKEIS